jgi:hypothetical protein
MMSCSPHLKSFVALAVLLSGCGLGADYSEDTLGKAETAPVGQSLPEPAIRRVDPPTLDAEQRRRQAEVDQYLAQRYDDLGWRIVETTQTYMGDIIDWLDPASVPGSEVEPPPRPSPEELRPAPGKLLGLTELDMHPELRGPEGTTPVLRPSFAGYVQGRADANSIVDFINRHHVPGMPAGQKRLYAGLGKVVANKGAGSWVNTFGGTIESNTLSLLEMAVVCRGSNPSTTHEQVGIAASRDRRIYFDSTVRLQVEFLTAGDEATGPQVGGWDPFFSGFVAAAGRPYPPGVALTVSTIGGPQYDHRFVIQISNGNWWVGHAGNWLGYYPGSLFNLINAAACEALWYGEVYDPTPTNWTWTDMGSGLLASTGYGNASYFRNPTYIATSGLSYWADGASNLSPNAAACYTRTNLLSGAAPFERYFYLGGPGGEASGCD